LIMRKAILAGLAFWLFFAFTPPLDAQSNNPVQYVYDGLGRLTQVIDPNGNAATYNYDAVGNLLSITRSTTSPSGLAIFSFSPTQGGVGQTVTIQGQNFSATPSANAVQFNGTAATVTAATTNQLTTTVPAGATTGPISVTVGTSTATSSTNFTVLTVPVVTSVSPTQVLNTPTVSFQVNGSNLTGATFSFVPAFTPAAITVSNLNINGNGTSATMTLTLASNAAGSFTVVATNGNGSTSSTPSLSNTLTIVATDPFADFDGDGLTNIYESAITTNFAAVSTTGDGLPDGWALFYTSAPPLSSALAGQTAPNGLTYLQSFQQGLNPLMNTVAPSVSVVYPANNTTNYPTNGVIVVRFTEPLQGGVSLTVAQSAINTALPSGSGFSASNASAAAQVLQGYLNRTCCGTTAIPGSVQLFQNGKPVAGNVYLSNDRLSLTFAPTKFLSASTTYTVSVQNVQDAGGHVMTQPFTSTFTTGLSPNLTTPGAGFTNPAQGATGVDINSTIRIEFSSPVNPATLTSTTFSVADLFTGNGAVSGTIQVDPFLLTASFVPSQPWGVGRSIRATLTSRITDFAGHSFFPNGTTLTFTTGFGSDTQGLSLVGTSPADGATSVPLNALVILEFGEPIDQISALKGLQVQQAGIPIAGAVALSDGNKRLTFTPSSALAANMTYLVVTTTQLTDTAGNPVSNPDTSTFTTGTTTDTTQPSVSTVSPANGAAGVATNAIIQAQFSKPIDPLTVTNATFSVSEANANPEIAVAGTITVSSNGLTATFTPSAPLAPGTIYAIQVGNSAPGGATIGDMEGNTLSSASSTTFTTGAGTVTAAPTVIVSPPNGATGVPVNPSIDVVASAPISAASPWSTAVTLSVSGVAVPGTTTLSSDRTTLTFRPTNLLAVSTAYTIAVSGFTDQAGNVVTPFTSSFTTGTSGTANTTQPSVSTVSPTAGATGVPVASNIVLTFNEAIDPNAVKNTTIPITLNNTSGPVLAGSYAVTGATVTFTPLTALPGSTSVFVAVPVSGVQDLSGNKNTTTNFSSSFTTASTADTTVPQVVAVAPSNGATGIGLNATVVLTFSKSLNPSTVTTNTFGLLANGAKLNVSIAHSADNRVVSLTPLAALLPASSTVTVVATSAVQDLSGNALANFESQFMTAAAFDTAHPSVFSQRPGAGAIGVPVSTSVVLYVTEPLNSATIAALQAGQGALHVSQNGVLVTGTTQVTDGGQTIQFTPSSPFAYGAAIQVFLDSTALDTDGSSLTSYQGSFTTVADPTKTAPVLVNTNPLSSSGVPTNIVIDIGFNQALNPATVNSTNVIFQQGGTTVVPSTVSLLSGGTVIQINPTNALAPNTSYTYQITSGVQNTNGLAFAGQGFLFGTGAGPDTVVPTITSVSPHNGLSNVGNNASVSLVFSKPVNQLTVSGSTIQLTGGGTTAVPDSINFSNNNQNVQLVPHAPLPDATLMTLTISGVTDVAGNAVTTQTTQFTTGTGPDVVTPAVVLDSPFNGESNVPLNTVIQVRVNDPIDPGSVTSSSFTVGDSTAGQTVAGSYSVSADGLTITFVPSAPLAANHTISVQTGNAGIKNLVGNPLIGGLTSFTFSTGTATSMTAPHVVGMSPPSGMTGVPINAQVAIQFNEPVDALTINQVTLAAGGTVNVTRTLENGNQILLLTPVLPLSPSTTYTVTVTGIQDVSGNSLGAPVTQTFTTGPGADLTPPVVATVSPASNATGVLRNSVIQLQFNKQIVPFMVTNSTFTVTPIGGQPIAGTINVSANGLTATFTPSATLAASTQYQIVATNAITDLEGQPLTSFSSFFTTGTQ
jgi:large repetitive protein